MSNYVQTLFKRHQDLDSWSYSDNQNKLTYADLHRQTKQMANWLFEHGVKPGDRVSILLLDQTSTLTLFLGAIWAGAVPVISNIRGREENTQYQVKFVEPAVVITDSAHVNNTRTWAPAPVWDITDIVGQLDQEMEHAVNRADTDISYMAWTSGTTGHFKAVMHSHAGLLAIAQVTHDLYNITKTDRVYNTPKLFFAYGISVMSAVLYGAAQGLLEPGLATPALIKQNCQSFKPTHFSTVPVIYAQLSNQDWIQGFSARCLSAGDRLPQALLNTWQQRTGTILHNMIGSTEMGTAYTVHCESTPSLGKLLPGFQARIVDEQGNVLPIGQTGVMEVDGPTRALGYYKDPKWTAHTFGTWVNTGDVCYQDAAGNFYHMGRAGDTIKIHGIWVNPLDLEETLTGHPAVEQAAVVSSPNAQGVDNIEAHVVLRSTVTPAELKKWMLRTHEKNACPRKIHIVAELPRTDTGKIQRYKLRAQM
jgi:acyl-coenzyme A synthetase/AMP-(fatty) acid ligase